MRRALWAAGVVSPVLFACTTIWLHAMWQPEDAVRLLNAEMLYVPLLLQDLLHGGALSDWVLTPAPYLFPDLPLYALIRLLGFGVSSAAGVIVFLQPMLALAALGWLLRLHRLASALPWVAMIIACALMLFELHLSATAAPLVVFALHCGGALASITSLALAIASSERSSPVKMICAGAVCVLTAMSDPLFVLATSPALAVLCIGGRVKLRFLVIDLSSMAVGLALRWVIPLPPRTEGLISAHRTQEAWRIFVSSLDAPLVMLWVLAGWTLIIVWRDRPQRVLVAALLASMVSFIIGLLASGVSAHLPVSRYLISHHLMLTAVLAILLSKLIETRTTWLVLVLVVGVGVVRERTLARRLLLSPIAAPAGCVNVVQQSHPFTRCVADYWAARPMALFSPAVSVVQATPEGRVHWFGNTKRPLREGGAFDCAVYAENENQQFEARFGAGTFRQACDGFVVHVFEGEEKRAFDAALGKTLEVEPAPFPYF